MMWTWQKLKTDQKLTLLCKKREQKVHWSSKREKSPLKQRDDALKWWLWRASDVVNNKEQKRFTHDDFCFVPVFRFGTFFFTIFTIGSTSVVSCRVVPTDDFLFLFRCTHFNEFQKCRNRNKAFEFKGLDVARIQLKVCCEHYVRYCVSCFCQGSFLLQLEAGLTEFEIETVMWRKIVGFIRWWTKNLGSVNIFRWILWLFFVVINTQMANNCNESHSISRYRNPNFPLDDNNSSKKKNKERKRICSTWY